MERYRYGTKEIIATVTGVALIVCSRFLVNYLISVNAVPAQFFEWIAPRILITAVAAVFFGPITGMLCGLAGDLLIYVIFGGYIGYPEMLVLGLYGFFLGLYFGKMHYEPARYGARMFIDFNAIQIMCGIIASMLLLPLIKFLSQDTSLYDSIYEGFRSAVGNSLLVGIICPILMFIVSIILKRKEQKAKDAAEMPFL